MPLSIIIFILVGFFVRNPIYALLSILFSFIISSVLLFNMHCELIAYIFLIVYLGAVMMLFLFVIMLFNLQELKSIVFFNISKHIKYTATFLFIILFLNFAESLISANELNKISPFSGVNSIEFNALFFFSKITSNGMLVFKGIYISEYVLIFLFLSILLLFSMIASIVNAMATKRVI